MSIFGLGVSAGVYGFRAIRRYSLSLTQELARLAPEDGLRLFAWRFPQAARQGFPPASERVRYCPARLPGRLLTRLWNRGLPPSVEAFTGPLDLFHCLDNDVPKVRRAARGFTLHGLIPYMVPELLGPEERRLGQADIRRGAETCDFFISVSDDTRDWFLRLFPQHAGRVFVTPLGIDGGFSPEPSPEDEELLAQVGARPPFLLFVGALDRRKNVTSLLKAMRHLDRKEVQVVLAGGRTDPLPELDELLAVTNARVTGWLPPDGQALRALYRRAEAFVFPTLAEGWTSPPLEAMASGTPVVASNLSSLPETVGDAALLVDPREPEALAEALRRVLDDASLREELVLRGRERAARFTWERCARLTLEAYREVLKR